MLIKFLPLTFVMTSTRKQLLDTVLPLHYDLLIHTDTVKKTFTGAVTIHVTANTSVNKFSVNANGLKVHKYLLLMKSEAKKKKGVKVKDGEVTVDVQKDKLVDDGHTDASSSTTENVRLSDGKVNNENEESMSDDQNESRSTESKNESSLNKRQNDKNLIPATISVDEAEQLLTFTLSAPLKGSFTINIYYSGVIQTDMSGYYLSKYQKDNDIRQMFSTHFEATDARKAFPCFDQPGHKATFRIKMTGEDPLTVLSNQPVEKTMKVNEAMKIADKRENYFEYKLLKTAANPSFNYYSFHTTPIMSTYLVAFAMGELDKITSAEDNLTISVYSPLNIHHGKFALECATKCISYFATYFDIPYPLPKIDMVAIPEFSMGAMENWGLITYRMSSLLFDPDNSTIHTKKNIAETVCHELAHQWFGNLVTMKWWDDLWLNEGFATWASYKAMENIGVVDIDVWTSFIANDVEYGLGADSLRSSHPILTEVNDPLEIDQIFDSIVYSKGASLIRMLEEYVEADVFKKGIRRYLKRFTYGNAETKDLWKSIEEESGKEIVEMMTVWVGKAGYPLLRVVEGDGIEMDFDKMKDFKSNLVNENKDTKEGNDNKSNLVEENKDKDKNNNNLLNDSEGTSDITSGKRNEVFKEHNSSKESNNDKDENNKKGVLADFVLKQERFLLLKDNELSSDVWYIPLKIGFFSEINPTLSHEPLITEMRDKEVRLRKPNGFYKFNHGGTGFFRVLYSNFNNIQMLLKNDILESRNKLNLMNDLFALSIGFYIKPEVPIKLSSYFKNEDNSEVIASVLGGLGEIKGIFYDDKEQREKLERVTLELVKHRIADIDIKTGVSKGNKPSFNEIARNGYIMDSAVACDDESTIKMLNDVYNQFKQSESAVHPIFRRSLYIAVVKHNNNEFDNLWNKYLKTMADDQKNQILLALGLTRSKEKFNFLLAETLKENIKVQDKIYLFVSLISNLEFRDNVIELLMERFSDVYNILMKNNSLFSYVIERVFGVVASDHMFGRSREFLKGLTGFKGVSRAVMKSLERGEIRNRFRRGNVRLDL